jgi:hypothetical protein
VMALPAHSMGGNSSNKAVRGVKADGVDMAAHCTRGPITEATRV